MTLGTNCNLASSKKYAGASAPKRNAVCMWEQSKTRLEQLASSAIAAVMPQDQDSILSVLRDSGLFDSRWYLETYPDVAQAGVDPVFHYVTSGAAENRDPAPWFSTSYYCGHYPDVAQAGLNPFYHYIYAGYSEKRLPCEMDVEARVIAEEAAALAGGKKFAEAAERYELAVEAAETQDFIFSCRMAQGRCFMATKSWKDAEEKFLAAYGSIPKEADTLAALGESLQRQAKWWQEIEVYEKALRLDESKAAWWFELAKAREIMKRWAEAAEAYERAIALDAKWAEWHYRLGWVREQNGLPRRAQEAYADAIARDNRLGAKKFGIGVFHAQRGYWPEAALAYEKLAQAKMDDAELQARLAVAWHRCHEFEKAAAANLNVLAFTSPGAENEALRGDAFYRLGIAFERLGRLEDAAQAYAATLAMRYDKYRCYRFGYVLAQAGRHEEACEAWLRLGQNLDPVAADQETLRVADDNPFPDEQKAEENVEYSPAPGEELTQSMAQITAKHYAARLKENATDPEIHFLAGFWLEKAGDMAGAAQAYADSAARQSDHSPKVWYRLGRALAACGRFTEACDAFANVEILRRPYWVDRGFYNKNIWFKRRADYLEYCEHLPIAHKTALYESMHGASVGDNPHAIFLHMLRDPAYTDWTFVWSLESLDAIPDDLKSLPNVIFIRRESDAYLRYLATAKILVNNVTWPEYFSRRDGQLYLNTWHGTPMKTLGKDIKDDPLGYYNATRNFLHCTHIIHPNKFTENIILNSYNIRNIFTGVSAITGYPRMDISICLAESEKTKLKKRLGIPCDKKVLLYAPTWRGNLVINRNLDTSIEFIKNVLTICNNVSKEYVTIFRGHHIFERYGKENPNCIIAPQNISSNEIVSISDVIITDYSSIAFDFLSLGKPIILYCHDLEEYNAERGFNIYPNELSVLFCQNAEDLKSALESLSSWKIDDNYKKLQNYFCEYDDGSSSKRVIKLFETNNINKNNEKKNILFYIDFLKNGVGMSGLALCNELARLNKYNIYILVNINFVKNNPEAVDMLDKLDPACMIIPSNRSMTMTIEEKILLDRYTQNRGDVNDKIIFAVKNIYMREYKRLFSDTVFDAIIDFTGYAAHQSELFSFANNITQKLIYLHNDMEYERKVRFPYLERIFRIYKNYDKIVSVSSSISEVNKKSLAARYDIPEDKFVFCPNIQRPDHIVKAATIPLADADKEFFADNTIVFINVARLSPEKNQKMLLRAFAIIHAKHASTRLLIVGKGSLEQELHNYIAELGLDDSVFVTGFRDNPYPILKRADCFVLSSSYEGQPVVFFEAMALNKPIVATDIPSSREVLENGKYGLLTDSTPEAFASGMEAFLRGEVTPPDFDFGKYQQDAIRQFESLLEPEQPEQVKSTVMSPEAIKQALEKTEKFDSSNFQLYKDILYSACMNKMYNFDFAKTIYRKKYDPALLDDLVTFLLSQKEFLFRMSTDTNSQFRNFFLIIEQYINRQQNQIKESGIKSIYSLFNKYIQC